MAFCDGLEEHLGLLKIYVLEVLGRHLVSAKLMHRIGLKTISMIIHFSNMSIENIIATDLTGWRYLLSYWFLLSYFHFKVLQIKVA